MIPFDEALARLLGGVHAVGSERVPLALAAGRVLAEDLSARTALPAFDHSSMDGYAVASSDFDGAGPWTLPVAGESAAGGVLPTFAPRTACRIYTGARLPAGADTVVMQEHVVRDDDRATFRVAPPPGAFVRRAGSDLAAGVVALARGTRLGPGHVALAAALDRPEIVVSRRPVVTILATGDELRSPGDPRACDAGSVLESNAYFVAAATRAAGGVATIAPFVPDELDAATSAVRHALASTDVLVTIGGVSVGDRDVMKPALEAAGVVIDFWRVAIKPGKPLAVGRGAGAHVLGLPGNPASASLTFLLFGLPLVRALAGDARPLPARTRLAVEGSLTRETGRQEFVRARLSHGGTTARLFSNQASGAVTSFAEADVLVVVPAERSHITDGDELEAIRIADC